MGEKTCIHLSALGYTYITKLGTSLESRIKKRERERNTQLPIWQLQRCFLGISTMPEIKNSILNFPTPCNILIWYNSPKPRNYFSFLSFPAHRTPISQQVLLHYLKYILLWIYPFSSASIAFCYSNPSSSLTWTTAIVSPSTVNHSKLFTQQLEWLFKNIN